MDILKRLIGTTPSRKTSLDQSNRLIDCPLNFADNLDLSSLCWSPYNKLHRGMLRLIIFSHGNRLVYDSMTVISVTDRILPDCPKSKCGGFQYLPHASDTKQIEKMVFGTSSMPDIFKVHTLADSDTLMLSRVFSVSKSNKIVPSANNKNCYCATNSGSVATSSDSDYQLNYSTVRSLDALRDFRANRGVLSKTPSYSSTDPPDGFTRLRNASLQLDVTDDNAFIDPLRAFSPNRISRVRRRQLSLKGLCDDGTCLQNGVLPRRSRMSSCSSATEHSTYTSLQIPVNSVSTPTQADKCARNYGIAILFPGEDKEFVFQHILQIEADILRLIGKINLATAQKAHYLKLVYEAWLEFCASTCLLHNSMRLRLPVWLSLTDSRLQDRTANEFCQRLAKLVDQLNTKDTQFFLSTLISTVLMSHLSWVASITPPDVCSYDRSLLLGTNPYNAKAAQFVELLGGIGFDNPTARTVVFGTDPQLVAEILFVLSYFIRCSSVENKRRELLTPDLVSPMRNFVDESTTDPHSAMDKVHTIAVPMHTANHHAAMSSSIGSEEHSSGRSHCITPPPVKVRAVSVTQDSPPTASPNNLLLRQTSNSSRQCYALMVDTKQVNSPCELVPAATDTTDSSTSAPRSHLHLCELERPTDFGRSLLAGVCNGYSPHFVLSGIDKRQVTVEEAQSHIHRELCSPPEEISPNTSAVNFNGASSSNILSLAVTIPNSQQINSDGMLLKTVPTTTTTAINAILDGAKRPDGTFELNACSPSGSDSGRAVPSSLYVDVNDNIKDTASHRTDSVNGGESTSTDTHSQHSHMSRSEAIKPSAVVILADSSTYTVKVISGGTGPVDECDISSPSETIASMLEEFVELYKQKCASTFLISFLEDRLGSILLKSNVLVGIINDVDKLANAPTQNLHVSGDFKDLKKNGDNDKAYGQFGADELMDECNGVPASNGQATTGNGSIHAHVMSSLPPPPTSMAMVKNAAQSTNFITMEQMSRILDCHCSDLRLILNVASVYSPGVLTSVV